ncbi:hypothetical protein [Streptomyces davaonensis]|uniref:hypothetical protein n=1 Tax=Streptomyces davaonensis TaxID=348043 RepID=UPI001872D76F|nr:hypothetical protein [Streptomyces davaonensis]
MEDVRLRRLYEGRWVVSRAWIVQYTGAASSTVARWYARREEQVEELRHPEVVCSVGRVHYFDQQAVVAFWAAWQQDVGAGLLGVSGRRAGDGQGARGGGHSRAQREQAVGVALQALRAAGGYRRGLAAELARVHGGVARSWQRAVTEARALYEQGTEQGQ